MVASSPAIRYRPGFTDGETMRIKRTFWTGLVLLLAALATSVGVVFYMAGRKPANYSPARLEPDQRQQAATDFYNRVIDFGNQTQMDQPFAWSIEQRRLKHYLASMDEIAAQTPSGRPGQVRDALADVGLDEPDVALKDGVLTLMVRMTEMDKVMAADLGLAIDEAGKLRVTLQEVRVGDLPIPKASVEGQLDKLKELLEPHAPAGRLPQTSASGIASEDLARLLAAVIRAIDAEPIDPELVWPVNHKRVRIVGIDITPESMTLRVEPVEAL
jgi:hypothetical protein